MNYFEQQDAARYRTMLLLLYFLLAVLVLLPLGYGVLLGAGRLVRNVYNFFGTWTDIRNRFEPLPHPGWWDAALFAWVTGIGLLLMLGGACFRLCQLTGGGHVVARGLGGERVATATPDPLQRRLLHVVEEMAIAAGLPLPLVYVLKHQRGINAFAAGWTPDDAVIVVTQGCLERLSRDELQAVVAHEFSHILHGDTRLKTLLSGLLHGIMFPADMARVSMGEMARSEPFHVIVSLLIFLLLGFVTIPLLLILEAGSMLAALIKRLLSRQRELLADAFAVQFTRHPASLAGALKKVGGLTMGGRVLDGQVRGISHLFFVDALGRDKADKIGLCAVHPSLVARICKLDAGFDGTFAFVPGLGSGRNAVAESFRGVTDGQGEEPFEADHGVITQSIGAPGGAHLDFVAAMLGALPEALTSALHDSTQAESVLYVLLLSDASSVRQAQLQHLQTSATAEAYAATIAMVSRLPMLPAGRRLPLVLIAINSLKQVTVAQYRVLRENLQALIAADSRVSLFEYGLQRMVLRHLGPAFGETPSGVMGSFGAKAMLQYGRDLLACLAYWGTYDILDQDQAFRIGMNRLTPTGMEPPAILSYEACTVECFGMALDRVAYAPSRFKQRLIEACVACIAANHKTSPQEAECLQVIADALGCPMPPILPPLDTGN